MIRKRSVSVYLAFLFVVVGFGGLISLEDVEVEGATITVDDDGGADYAKIQEAVYNASNGDTIIVQPGHYIEHVVVNRAVTIIGSGSSNTIIERDEGSEVIRIQVDGVSISGFTITNGPNRYHNGIQLFYADDTVIFNNNITSNNHGIASAYSTNNMIANNTFYSNQVGIWCSSSSDDNVIEYNNFNQHLDGGLWIQSSNRIIVDHNNLNNDDTGMLITSDSTVIKNNEIRNCEGRNIWMGQSPVPSYIYHNSFYGLPSDQATDDGSNIWNNNLLEGNYWSDYDGNDDGSNGRVAGDAIGDTNLPHQGVDNHPFMYHLAWKMPQTPTITNPIEGYISREGEFIITWNPCYNADGYQLEVSQNESFYPNIILYEGSNSFYNISELNDGCYYYKVRSYGDKGLSYWSDILQVQVDLLPIIPSNFSARAFSEGNAINLSWSPNEKNTNSYQIYFRTNSAFKYLATLYHPNCTFDHESLVDGVMYTYQIRSIDLTYELSDYTEPIIISPMDTIPPTPPDKPIINSVSHDYIGLEWNESTDEDVVGYNIYRSEISDPISWGSDWGEPIHENIPVSRSSYTDTDLEELTRYHYVVTALDEAPNESDFSEEEPAMTIQGPHPPEINNSVHDFEIPEDTIDNTTINMYRWFKDQNQDVLDFQCTPSENLEIVIDQNSGDVEIIPDEDWSGSEHLTFKAFDRSSSVDDDLWINVTPVNDPPEEVRIIRPPKGTQVFEGDSLTFVGNANDVDIPYGDELQYTWYSNISGKLGNRNQLQDFILELGHHNITFAVNDKDYAYTNVSINVKVIPKNETVPVYGYTEDDHNEEDTEEEYEDDDIEPTESSGSSWAFYGVIFFVMILVIILFVMNWSTIFGYFESKPKQVHRPLPPVQRPSPPKPLTPLKPVDRDTMVQNTTQSQLDEAMRLKYAQEPAVIRPERFNTEIEK